MARRNRVQPDGLRRSRLNPPRLAAVRQTTSSPPGVEADLGYANLLTQPTTNTTLARPDPPKAMVWRRLPTMKRTKSPAVAITGQRLTAWIREPPGQDQRRRPPGRECRQQGPLYQKYWNEKGSFWFNQGHLACIRNTVHPALPPRRAERALDLLNFVLADVRYGLGPYGIIYLISIQGWTEAGIALAFSFGSIAGLVSQTPIGAMVDRVRAKRALAVGALLLVAAASLSVPFAPGFWPVAAAGVAGALANSTLGTVVAAISLGVVGPEGFARRAARNEAFFHGGSAFVNLAVMALAPVLGIMVVFWLLASAALLSVMAVLAVPARAIDHDTARGLRADESGRTRNKSLRLTLLENCGLLAFALCGAFFHMANASMLALVMQRAARTDPENAVVLAAAAMITAQAAMIATAALAGMRADRWGRRPFFLTAFAALALRGVFYTISDDPLWTVAVQLLDGVGVGVFGALFPVVIADLTRGSGHFNAAQGAVGTIHGIGGLIGGPISAAWVVWAGYDAAFLFLAAIAAGGGLAFLLSMPETSNATMGRNLRREGNQG